MYKGTCGGRAGASPEWTVPTAPRVCVHLDGLNAENTFHCWLYSIIVYVTKKKKYRLFFLFIFFYRYPIMVKCLNIGKNIGRSLVMDNISH